MGYRDDSTDCGAHRHRSADGTATLDQDERIDALIPIRSRPRLARRLEISSPTSSSPSWEQRPALCSPGAASQRASSPCRGPRSSCSSDAR
eukprot:7553599-Pyramimonas_sp.AAC.1